MTKGDSASGGEASVNGDCLGKNSGEGRFECALLTLGTSDSRMSTFLNMKAILLAAGFATRLYPLTRNRAKPLLEVGGQPIINHLIGRIQELPDLSEIIVVANAKFSSDFAGWKAGFQCRVPVEVLNDGTTSDATKLGAIRDIEFATRRADLNGEDWIVAAGDNLIGFDLRPCHAAFRRSGRPTILVRKIDEESRQRKYNEVRLDSQGNVRLFREKPASPESRLAAICFYFLTPEVVPLLGDYLAAGGNPDAPGYFIEWLSERISLAATGIGEPWFDIGDRASLEEAREVYEQM